MKILLVAGAFLVVASAGADCLPSNTYVGLFADSGHSVMSVNYAGTATQFELWIWWLPSERGLQAVEFGMTYPANVIRSTITCAVPGIGACWWWNNSTCLAFDEGLCQMDWVWTHHQTCFLTDAMPSVIEIGPFSGMSEIESYTCEAGYPAGPATIILNKLALNQEEVIAVEPQSWGAIKNLYR